MAQRGRPLDYSLRQIICQLMKQGHLSERAIAIHLGLSRNTVAKYKKNLKQV